MKRIWNKKSFWHSLMSLVVLGTFAYLGIVMK